MSNKFSKIKFIIPLLGVVCGAGSEAENQQTASNLLRPSISKIFYDKPIQLGNKLTNVLKAIYSVNSTMQWVSETSSSFTNNFPNPFACTKRWAQLALKLQSFTQNFRSTQVYLVLPANYLVNWLCLPYIINNPMLIDIRVSLLVISITAMIWYGLCIDKVDVDSMPWHDDCKHLIGVFYYIVIWFVLSFYLQSYSPFIIRYILIAISDILAHLDRKEMRNQLLAFMAIMILLVGIYYLAQFPIIYRMIYLIVTKISKAGLYLILISIFCDLYVYVATIGSLITSCIRAVFMQLFFTEALNQENKRVKDKLEQ